MFYRVVKVSTDGTNDVKVPLVGQYLSVSVVPDTTSTDISVRPSQGDALPVKQGKPLTLELAGTLLTFPDGMTLINTSATAVVVYLLLAIP